MNMMSEITVIIETHVFLQCKKMGSNFTQLLLQNNETKTKPPKPQPEPCTYYIPQR